MQTDNNHIPFHSIQGVVKFFRAKKDDHYLAFIFAADMPEHPMRFIDIREIAKIIGHELNPDAFIRLPEEQRLKQAVEILQAANAQLDITQLLQTHSWMWRPK